MASSHAVVGNLLAPLELRFASSSICRASKRRAHRRVTFSRSQSSAAAASQGSFVRPPVTSTPTDAPSLPEEATPKPLIFTSPLISRAPLLLPPLTPFERHYYDYQTRIQHALSRPLDKDWYFRKGSVAERNFIETEQSRRKSEEEVAKKSKAGKGASEADVEARRRNDEEEERKRVESEADRKGDLRSLERRLDRTLYLLVKSERSPFLSSASAKGKKDAVGDAWHFPLQAIHPSHKNTLLASCLLSLREQLGEDMDIWDGPSTRAVAGYFSWPLSSPSTKSTPSSEQSTSPSSPELAETFFLPMKILRGQANIQKSWPANTSSKDLLPRVTDFAWLTKEEVGEKVEQGYWERVNGMLNNR